MTLVSTMISALLLLAAPASEGPTLVDVATLDARFRFDIKYATADNFVGKVLYPAARCLLRPEVGAMVVRAQRFLDDRNRGHVLMFKDCYRPESVQHIMWAAVRGTPKQGYVADPTQGTGSVHNYGAAVDLTVAGPDGREVDMGTPYDHLGELSEPRREDEFLRAGKLTAAQVSNRRVLRAAMVEGAGFTALKHEWWHFDALQGAALRQRYGKLDVPLAP